MVHRLLVVVAAGWWCSEQAMAVINREAVVARHTPTISCSAWQADECNPLDFQTVGNGDFAFSVDVTGLQTFNTTLQTGAYCNPLNTMSTWGWHTTPIHKSQWPAATPHSFVWQNITAYNKSTPYPTGCSTGPCHYGNKQQQQTTSWLRANPHRLNLGRIAFATLASTAAGMEAITDIKQTTQLWEGYIHSHFVLDGRPVSVKTVVHPTLDMVSVEIESDLVHNNGSIGLQPLLVELSFPYGSESMNGNGADWTRPDDHSSVLKPLPATAHAYQARVDRMVDSESYTATVTVEGDTLALAQDVHAIVEPSANHPHTFKIYNAPNSTTMSFSVAFQKTATATATASASASTSTSKTPTSPPPHPRPTSAATLAAANLWFLNYWNSGAAIDFSKSTDPRAKSLESKMIMSQWVEANQESGTQPLGETGLVSNSWWGKFHGEMRMWHQSHFAAFGRPQLFVASTDYYLTVLDEAKLYAKKQGYSGARWFKMRAQESNTGLFTGPSVVGPLLLQEQGHPIVYAELLYNANPNNETLQKYSSMVHETAEFMASFALQAKGHNTRGCLNLGPPFAPGMGVEADDPGNKMNFTNTANGCYENTYWRFGLGIAQKWRARLGLPVHANWTEVSATLCKPAVRSWHGNSAYFFDDGSKALIGTSTALGQVFACGHIPCLQNGIDAAVMKSTLKMTIAEFDFNNSYPGDNAVYAMAAARLGMPDAAVDFLSNRTDTAGNRYNPKNGYWQGFFPALVGTNGQFLYALAMMAGGGWAGAGAGVGGARGDAGGAGDSSAASSNGDAKKFPPGFPIDWEIEAEGFPGVF